MAEVYPSDAYLTETFLTDDQIGVTFLVGTDVGVLPWQKYNHRMTKALGPMADLRGFDEGDLDLGVKSGYYYDGNTLITYAGATGQTLADDKATIYIYLTGDGELVIDEYDSYPDPSVPHVRLAEVTTSGGDITAITDRRAQNLWGNPGMAAKAAAVNIMCYEGDVLTYDEEVLVWD